MSGTDDEEKLMAEIFPIRDFEETNTTGLASESSLKKDWLRHEEDVAWDDL
jgi:hypothetical protein